MAYPRGMGRDVLEEEDLDTINLESPSKYRPAGLALPPIKSSVAKHVPAPSPSRSAINSSGCSFEASRNATPHGITWHAPPRMVLQTRVELPDDEIQEVSVEPSPAGRSVLPHLPGSRGAGGATLQSDAAAAPTAAWTAGESSSSNMRGKSGQSASTTTNLPTSVDHNPALCHLGPRNTYRVIKGRISSFWLKTQCMLLKLATGCRMVDAVLLEAHNSFLQYDTDRDGYLSREDLYEGLKDTALDVAKDVFHQYIDSAFMYADYDRDGLLNFAEYLTMHKKRKQAITKFHIYDKDADGFINKDDFRSIVLDLKLNLEEDMVKSYTDMNFRFADRSFRGTISVGQFLACYATLLVMHTKTGAAVDGGTTKETKGSTFLTRMISRAPMDVTRVTPTNSSFSQSNGTMI